MASMVPVFLVFLPIIHSSFGAVSLNLKGSFVVKSPAFSTLYKDTSPQGSKPKYNLIVSTFAGPTIFGPSVDSVQLVRDMGMRMNDISSITPEVITKSVIWPNEISVVPDGIFQEHLLAIPDGFLVPTKTNGAIKLVDVSTPGHSVGPFIVSEQSNGEWFYHRVEWKDMDGDGDQDIVTCRAREPIIPIIFGRKDEELVWLENPSGNYKTTWKTHVLAHGPDVYFRLAQLATGDGAKPCIFTAQFFTESISVYWSTNKNGLFTNATELQSRVIDNSIGRVFDVELADLNNDGRVDLLVTTNGNNGSLLAYEIPDDFRTGRFIKHVIAVGFTPRKPGTGKGAPGSAIAVHAQTNDTNSKPIILLSGDDDGRAYAFEASNVSPTDWNYRKSTFVDAGDGTVGELSAGDVDGDGYSDVFAPSFNENKVYVYSFKTGSGGSTIMG
ncbi:uncharacterized protein LOC127831467 [Dreissena polymorpha]|uniref:VCBS repeat-containing protein n=1 Tax=Dreissena polymorpha TaxID=45954 RepID=A0A9D4RVD8_DREPO|nr:uncharacterized protein LOC127831467 [Dreissena polymorpha]KAH3882509.1 hypothetical protein DPMN_006449 [Dreissena polymorpha]